MSATLHAPIEDASTHAAVNAWLLRNGHDPGYIRSVTLVDEGVVRLVRYLRDEDGRYYLVDAVGNKTDGWNTPCDVATETVTVFIAEPPPAEWQL